MELGGGGLRTGWCLLRKQWDQSHTLLEAQPPDLQSFYDEAV